MAFTACTDLSPLVCYADDFNRADNLSLGANWTEYSQLVGFAYGFGFDIASNRLRALGFQGAFPSGSPRTAAAAFAAFPADATHQSSRLIFKQSYLSGAKDTQITNYQLVFGGPSVRLQQIGVGSDFDANCSCYTLRYEESRSFNSPFDIVDAHLNLWLHTPSSVQLVGGAVEGVDIYTFTGGTHLNDGDELKLTAMNFEPTPGTTHMCLKGYVNGVVKLQATVTSPSLQLLTGKAGFSVGATNGTERGFGVDWDDWQGCTMGEADACNCVSILEVERDCVMTKQVERDCSFTKQAEC